MDDSDLVAAEYASEIRLAVRNSVQRDLVDGERAEDVALGAVLGVRPRRVLEVGCGLGEFSERLARVPGVEVIALDASPRMVELTRARGVDVVQGDVQQLDFLEESFDCVVANWMLYHVSDLDLAVSELARVLRPEGRLVAATQSAQLFPELWGLVGDPPPPTLSFTAENGEVALSRHFRRVERLLVEAEVVFPDYAAARTFIAATITRSHLADQLPKFSGSLRATLVHAVFVSDLPLRGAANP